MPTQGGIPYQNLNSISFKNWKTFHEWYHIIIVPVNGSLMGSFGSWKRVRLVGGLFYSETTWAAGIAQLIHHEVQGWGPSGELIAQYRPPMSSCFYPTLYLGNHLYCLKPDSSWKQQKNTWISEIDSVHSTKRVVMVTPQHLLVTS